MQLPLVVLLASSVFLAGCSAVPNMDTGSAACQNARGIGRAIDLPGGGSNMNVMPDLRGRTPAEARAIAVGRGHTVVFNVKAACWCVPPPGGTVTDQWFGEHGALWLWVDGFEPPSGDPPFRGWGC
jgi:hypothetical protein